MANVLTSRTWVLDTASTTVNITSRPVFISGMQYHPADADNDLVVQDGSGGPIWTIRSTDGAPAHESFGIERWVNPAPHVPFPGLRLHTIDGGTLYVDTI